MRLAFFGGHSTSSAVVGGVTGGSGVSISGAGGSSPVSKPSASSCGVYIVCQDNSLAS